MKLFDSIFSKRQKEKSPLLDALLSGIFQPTSQDELIGDTTLREFASENLLDGNVGSAFGQMKELVFQCFSDSGMKFEEFTGVRFYNINNCLDKILEQIEKGQLCLSEINFNDALDPLLSVYAGLKQKSTCHHEQKWFELLKEINSCFRICCLCPDKIMSGESEMDSIENQLMWAHYASSHTGICVKYRIQQDNMWVDKKKTTFCFMDKIRYADKKISINDITLDDALLLKSSQWQYEHEYRMVYFNPAPSLKYVPLNGVMIEAVYMGINITSKHRDQIKNVLKKLGIPLFQMHRNANDVMKISAGRVKQ